MKFKMTLLALLAASASAFAQQPAASTSAASIQVDKGAVSIQVDKAAVHALSAAELKSLASAAKEVALVAPTEANIEALKAIEHEALDRAQASATKAGAGTQDAR